MDALQEIRDEIAYYLRLSDHPRLAECLDQVPKENEEALYNMISDAQYAHHMTPGELARMVAEDMGALLEGTEVIFSKEHLARIVG